MVNLKKIDKKIITIFFLSILLFIFNVFENKTKERKIREKEVLEDKIFQETFGNLNLKAKSAYVFDITKNRQLYAYYPEKKLPIASITKIMTALVALESEQNEIIQIDADSLRMEGDNGLYLDEKWQKDDLLKLMLIVSSNDAAVAIRKNLDDNFFKKTNTDFVSKMNQKSKILGLDRLVFFNETGLDIDENNHGAYGSAKDIAFLMVYALKNYPEIFQTTSEFNFKINSLDQKEHLVENTDKLLENVAGIIASKTGFTSLAGGSLVLIYQPQGFDNLLAMSVLASTKEERFSDMINLIFASNSYLDKLKYNCELQDDLNCR